MRLFLVRHGETDINKMRLVQSWTDHPLNEIGREQAHRVGYYFKVLNKTFDFAYTSPLLRARETGNIIMSYFKNEIPIEVDYHFIERDFGVFEHKDVDPIIKMISEKGFTYPGYEDDKMLIKRIHNGLVQLYHKHPKSNIILFCHSHVIKSFLILAEPKKYNFLTRLDNASLHEFSYDGDTLKVINFNINVT